MSYATRCTACGTIFRVVQDQLRVSEGWVRCGRCAEVFDAREQLFDIDRDTPPFWAGDAEASPALPAQSPGLEAEEAEVARAELRRHSVMDDEPQSPMKQLATVPGRAAIDPHGRQEPHWFGAANEADRADEADEADEGRRTPLAIGSVPGATDTDSIALSPSPVAQLGDCLTGPIEVALIVPDESPSFMRTASAASRSQGYGVRLGMAGLTLLLFLGLAVQLLFHFRDAIAAVYPQVLPGLQALCLTSGCKVQAWRRIEALSVESSALTQKDHRSSRNVPDNHYQLTLSLHNKSGVPVATPSIELSLLNPSGEVIIRRVLIPTEFRQNPVGVDFLSGIAPGADFPLRLQLTTGAKRISGYSIEIFHP